MTGAAPAPEWTATPEYLRGLFDARDIPPELRAARLAEAQASTARGGADAEYWRGLAAGLRILERT